MLLDLNCNLRGIGRNGIEGLGALGRVGGGAFEAGDHGVQRLLLKSPDLAIGVGVRAADVGGPEKDLAILGILLADMGCAIVIGRDASRKVSFELIRNFGQFGLVDREALRGVI